ncbi:MAG: ABC transporter substrate-binding protein [Alphaproteobacteria bacterium]
MSTYTNVKKIALKILICLLVTISALPPLFAKDSLKLSISQFVSHPALNAVVKGIKHGLEDAGYKAKENLELDHQIAQGNMGTNIQIANRMANDCDILIAVSTPSAQAAQKAVQSQSLNTPVVFTAVSDHVSAGLTMPFVTGVTDSQPIDGQLHIIKQLLPEIKTIGILYNPGEANSVSQLQEIKKSCIALDIDIIESPVYKTSEIDQAILRVDGRVDAIYAPADNTVISAISRTTHVAHSREIPVFTADTHSVYHGAVASYGFGYYEIGIETAKKVIKIANGADPSEIPVEPPTQKRLYINLNSAKRLHLDIADRLLENSVIITEKEQK